MVNTGDTAWVLISAALVLLMTPGLALFYGGMVRAKSVLNMMMMSFGALALISVLWVLYGYSIAFGDDIGLGLLGSPTQYLGLEGLMEDATSLEGGLPVMAFVGFQAVFAIITVALISGAIADRARFGSWMVFAGVWATVVYFPVAHWVFAFDRGGVVGGWIANDLLAIDFAGGTAVHINAGAAGLALAFVLGKRRGFGREAMRPHNLPLVMIGAGLLWFGWFGFNAGSALAADNTASVAWVNTLVATAAATLGWLLVEKMRDGHSTSLGGASGVVAGALCVLAVGLEYTLGYDDSLDVVGVHLVGGMWGTIAIGFLATAQAPAGVDGLFYGGGVDQLWRQGVGAVAVLGFSFILTLVIGILIQRTLGFRITEEDEVAGIDNVVHAESGYDFASLGSSGSTAPLAGQARATSDEGIIRNTERTVA